jgi:hypothetical protein
MIGSFATHIGAANNAEPPENRHWKIILDKDIMFFYITPQALLDQGVTFALTRKAPVALPPRCLTL